MVLMIVAGLSLAPGMFWLWFIYRRDKWEPEPKKLVMKTFFYGAGVAIPVSIAESPFVASEYVLAVVAAPIVEEAFKFAAVYRTVYRDREFDEPMDGLVYAAAAALGFASVENPMYVWGAYYTEDPVAGSPMGSLLAVAAIRAVLSVPGHVLFSSMWGYALGWAKFTRHRHAARSVITRGLALAMFLHAAFNLLALSALPGALGLVALTAAMWWAFRRRLHRALARSPHRAPRPVGDGANGEPDPDPHS